MLRPLLEVIIGIFTSPIAAGLVVGILFIAYHFRDRGTAARTAWRGFAVVAAVVAITGLATLIWLRLVEPQQWDFLAFWMYAQVAVSGNSVYDPASFGSLALPFSPGEDFVREVLEVGLVYPPPFLVIVAPFGFLGFVDFQVAWYAVHLACLGAAGWLLGSAVADPGEKWAGALLVMCALLWIPATQQTIGFGQTNFMLLLVAAALWSQPRLRGYLVGAGMIIKPWVVFLVPWVWRRGGFSHLIHAAILVVLASLIVASFQGLSIFFDYLLGGVHSRLPAWVLTQPINQSLLAILARLHRSAGVETGLPLGVYYFICAAPIFALTGWRLLRSRDDVLGLAISIQAALLLYPSTSKHYCVLAMIPLLALSQRARATDFQVILVSAAIALYATLSAGPAFWANLGLWGILIAVDVRKNGNGPLLRG